MCGVLWVREVGEWPGVGVGGGGGGGASLGRSLPLGLLVFLFK